jgi:hypothetical protein
MHTDKKTPFVVLAHYACRSGPEAESGRRNRPPYNGIRPLCHARGRFPAEWPAFDSRFGLKTDFFQFGGVADFSLLLHFDQGLLV